MKYIVSGCYLGSNTSHALTPIEVSSRAEAEKVKEELEARTSNYRAPYGNRCIITSVKKSFEDIFMELVKSNPLAALEDLKIKAKEIEKIINQET